MDNIGWGVLKSLVRLDRRTTNGYSRTISGDITQKLVLPDDRLLLLKKAGMFSNLRPEGEIGACYGAFRKLHSNQGANFGSQVLAEVCRLFHIH